MDELNQLIFMENFQENKIIIGEIKMGFKKNLMIIIENKEEERMLKQS